MMVASVRDSGLDPSAKVAWIALIVIAPLLGWMLWLLVGRRLAGSR